MVEEDFRGTTTPPTSPDDPPDLKGDRDTVPPRVQFTNAKRNGEEIVAEWIVDDKHPDESKTQVHVRPVGSESCGRK